MKLALFSALALAAFASAMPCDAAVNDDATARVTPVGRLRLLDGRTLENVVIRSYDEQSSKVLIISNGTARLVPLDLIPPPFAEKIKASHARAPADLVQTTPVPSTSETAATTDTAPANPTPRPAQPTAPPPAVAKPDDPRGQHREAARAHAYRYFKYVFRTGSNAIAVTESDIEIDATEPIPGWNQYRTKGTAYLEIFDSVGGGSFSRRARRFEVVTEQKPGEEIKVIDFTRR